MQFTVIVSLVWVLQLALATANCVSYEGPSPYYYGIDKVIDYKSEENNLVAGWRQYNDQLIFKGNISRPSNDEYEDTAVFELPAGNVTYTQILSLDRAKFRGRGGIAYLVEGGIGFNYATIGYTYETTWGMDHNIEAYGFFDKEISYDAQ